MWKKAEPNLETCKLNLDKTINLAGFYLPPKKEKKDPQSDELNAMVNKMNLSEQEKDENNNKADQSQDEPVEEEKEYETTKNEANEANENNTSVDSQNLSFNKAADEENEEDEDDGAGWINPSNIEETKKQSLIELEEEDVKNRTIPVACMTSDFSMQNVLIQIGIPVLSVDGLLIKKARSYVLKCFHFQKDHNKHGKKILSMVWLQDLATCCCSCRFRRQSSIS